ncbi:unnamed protein product [[Candida] boidinii]|nr:unnamed protein product [[Candida] boidinii]
MTQTNEIVIVGAGVIGLSCAYQLVLEGYKVTILSSHLPSISSKNPLYTSAWAGAHFRPFPSKSKAELRDYPLTRSSYKKFVEISEKYPESSIKFVEGFDYIEKHDPLYENISTGYAEELIDFKRLPQNELPKNVKFGAKYKTYVLNAPVYVQFLERKLRMEYNVTITQNEVSSLKEVFELYPKSTVVNCTGTGLQYNGGYDTDSYKIRGQTLLVRPPKGTPYFNKTVTHQMANGDWSFVIERPFDGGFILGGTKTLNSLNSQPDEEQTKSLLFNGEQRFPELMITDKNGQKKFDVLGINVGFRPARYGGVRIEREVIKGHNIVHCYGFGGSGYEMSWGAAEKVLDIIQTAKPKL